MMRIGSMKRVLMAGGIRKKGLLSVLLMGVAVLGLLLSSCSSNSAETIKIGAFLPLSGWAAEYGKEAQRGIDLAVKEFNESGGLNGKQVRVIYEDSQASPKVSTSATKKLIEVDKVCAIVGSMFSHETLPAARIAQDAHIPLVGGQANHPDLPRIGEYIFHTQPPLDELTNVIADYAFKEKGFRRAAILAFDTDMGHLCMDTMKKRFPQLGGQVVFAELFPQGTSDFKTQLLKAKAANPDVLFPLGAPAEVVQILRQMAELNMKLPVMGSNMLREKTIIEIAGQLAEGAFYSNPGPVSDAAKERAKVFIEKYKQEYKEEPRTVTPFFANEAATLVLQAIKERGASPAEIQKWLAGVKDFPVACGEISFNEFGAPKRPIFIEVIKGGTYTRTDFWSYGD